MINLQPRRIQRLGWKPDLPDHRDFIFKPGMDAKSVPGTHSLVPLMPPIFDQMQLGSCTGNGWARIMQYMAMQEGELAATDFLSRLFIYYYERVIENSVGEDAGAEIRDGAKVVANYGAPPESLWPYSDANPGPFSQEPPQSVQDAAKKLEALQYQRVQVGGPGAPMRSAIAEGYPIVIGFPVPDYFENPSVWDPSSGQPLPVPGPNANIIGGHCVVLTGYDFTGRNFPPYFEADNSWGPGWGMGGRFRFHYRWFLPDESQAGDMWIVKKTS